MWKITTDGLAKVPETRLEQEEVLERSLEDWIAQDPSLIGEPLLVIGRQVMIPDVKDRIDILAVDPQGNAVIIELKRGELTDPVDMQALRYASYISKWEFRDFENQARAYLGKAGDPDFNFNQAYEGFCTEAGVDEAPDLNSDQRLIIVGSKVKDKLGSVALWLHDHGIDIKIVEVAVYREDDTILLQPQVIVPVPVSRFEGTGRPPRGEVSRPWITNGRSWHLEERCSLSTKEMLLRLDDLIRKDLEVDGPRWNQKNYVAYRVGSYNRIAIHTHPTSLGLNFVVKTGVFHRADLAQRLGVDEFDEEYSLADKLSLGSSVNVRNRNETTDLIDLRIKEDFDLESESLLNFLNEAYAAFPG